MKNKLSYIALFLLPVMLYAQERQPLHGRVVSGSIPAEGQLVVNLSTHKEMRADSLGNFTFMAKPGDTIVAAITHPKKVVLTIKEFNQNPFLIDIPSYELDEVVITKYNTINAEALRIVPKGVAKYTVAERRQRLAASARPYFDKSMTGGYVPLDPVYNLINGKSASMKRALKTEKKEMAIDKVNGIFNEDEITTLFKIPKEYVQGFIFYIIEDTNFAKAIKENNAITARSLISGLAMEYLDLLNNNE